MSLRQLASVLLDETSLALEARMAAAPASPDTEDWAAGRQPPAGPDEEAGLGEAGNGAGPAHAPRKALQDSDAGPVPNGGLVAALHASAKAKSAKGRGFWAVCSVLLLLLIVRSKLVGSGAGRPVAAQEPLHDSA